MRHELRLMRAGAGGLLLAAAATSLLGFLVAGRDGAASAAVATAILGANHALLAMSTGWARSFTPSVAAVGWSVMPFRLLGVFTAFAWAGSMPWIHRAMFAIAFCSALAITLAVECISYARKSYVPRWRLTT